MSAIIGSARIDENGRIAGGKSGDQSGKECSAQNWYLSSKGWIVIRPYITVDAELIARNMEYICKGNVGYDQSNRLDLYNKARNVGFDVSKLGNTPCETDCSEAVRVCCAFADIMVNTFTTANEVKVLRATKRFDVLTSDIYCKKSDYLKRGDILCTATKGHTVVVLSDGVKANALMRPYLQKGDYGLSVEKLQYALKEMNLYHGKIDSDFGEITKQSVIQFQGLHGLVKDGIVGSKTSHMLMQS